MGLAVLVFVAVVEKGEYVETFAEFYDHATVSAVKCHDLRDLNLTDSRGLCKKCKEGTRGGQVWLFLGIQWV